MEIDLYIENGGTAGTQRGCFLECSLSFLLCSIAQECSVGVCLNEP